MAEIEKVTQQTSPSAPSVSSDEKNLVVSFVQFLRQKVSLNQCSDEQIEGIEG